MTRFVPERALPFAAISRVFSLFLCPSPIFLGLWHIVIAGRQSTAALATTDAAEQAVFVPDEVFEPAAMSVPGPHRLRPYNDLMDESSPSPKHLNAQSLYPEKFTRQRYF